MCKQNKNKNKCQLMKFQNNGTERQKDLASLRDNVGRCDGSKWISQRRLGNTEQRCRK
jgi:hypothetical protein